MTERDDTGIAAVDLHSDHGGQVDQIQGRKTRQSGGQEELGDDRQRDQRKGQRDRALDSLLPNARHHPSPTRR